MSTSTLFVTVVAIVFGAILLERLIAELPGIIRAWRMRK